VEGLPPGKWVDGRGNQNIAGEPGGIEIASTEEQSSTIGKPAMRAESDSPKTNLHAQGHRDRRSGPHSSCKCKGRRGSRAHRAKQRNQTSKRKERFKEKPRRKEVNWKAYEQKRRNSTKNITRRGNQTEKDLNREKGTSPKALLKEQNNGNDYLKTKESLDNNLPN